MRYSVSYRARSWWDWRRYYAAGYVVFREAEDVAEYLQSSGYRGVRIEPRIIPEPSNQQPVGRR